MRKTLKGLALALAGALAVAPAVLAQNEGEGQGRAIVTVLPKNSHQETSNISQDNISLRVNGRSTPVAGWQSLRGQDHGVEFVLLIDNSVRGSIDRELGDIRSFINSLPPNVKMTVGYMQNGRAVLAGPLTTDHATILKGVHVALGVPGQSASPYFCLSDLAKNWPSRDRSARREVLMITNGVDPYHFQYDPNDPYVLAAIRDSVRARLVVYSVYWPGAGRVGHSGYANNAGQNLLLEVTDATGGQSYWQGFGSPVTLQPYFQDLVRRFDNQYELSFTAPLHRSSEIVSMKVKAHASGVKVDAPQQVSVTASGANQE